MFPLPRYRRVPGCQTCLTKGQGQNSPSQKPGAAGSSQDILTEGARALPAAQPSSPRKGELLQPESQSSFQQGPGDQGEFMELTGTQQPQWGSSQRPPSSQEQSRQCPGAQGSGTPQGPPAPSTSPRLPQAAGLCQAEPLTGHITVKQIHKK